MNSIVWFGSLYTSFEAAFHEVDDFVSQQQEDLEYAKIRMQMMGASIKQFCSDLVEEVFSESSVDRVEGASYDSSLVQNTDEADELLTEKKRIDECHCGKESCNVSQLLHSYSGEPVQVEDCKLHSEVTSPWIKENHSEEKKLELEASNSATPDNKDVSLVAPPISDDVENDSCEKLTPLGMSSSTSVNLVCSCESEISDISNLRSPHEMKLDESCIIVDSNSEFSSDADVAVDSSELSSDSHELVDNNELSSDSHEAGRHGSYKKKSRGVGRRAARQENDKDGHHDQSPESGQCEQEGEGSESFAVTTLDNEFSDSDWEII